MTASSICPAWYTVYDLYSLELKMPALVLPSPLATQVVDKDLVDMLVDVWVPPADANVALN